MRVKDFLALSTPLRLGPNGKHAKDAILIAFVIGTDDELGGMLVSPSGGQAVFREIDDIDFPAVVMAVGAPIASGTKVLDS